MQEFNLYREAKNNYRLLIPDTEDGLILLSLYEKFNKASFTEEKIIEVIEKVFKDTGKDTQRNEYNRNNVIIIRLQEYFLWRDEAKGTYTFRKYGLDFCKSIHRKLSEQYNPSKIKRLFDYLLNGLQTSLSSQESDFNQWVEDHFDARQGELAEQIEILDHQVSDSVKEFRARIKNKDADVFQLLNEIEISLDLLKKQVLQLIEVFKITYDIDDILTGILEQPDAIKYTPNVLKVQYFDDQTRSQLEFVSKRIDKIKPKLREFIYEFNQRDFDRKTELFLRHLLTKSSISKKEKGGKILIPPKDIPLLVIDTNITPKFNIVPLKEIGPKPHIEPVERKIDPEKRKNNLIKTRAKLFEKQRIQHWVRECMKSLEKNGKLDFSSLFFQILNEEAGNLSIAIKTAYQVLRKYNTNKNYKVFIGHEKTISKKYLQTTIWKMSIAKIQ